MTDPAPFTRTPLSTVHTSRTMMLADLEGLLNAVDPRAVPAAALRHAIVEYNVLGKSTQRTRLTTWRRLSQLYGLTGDDVRETGFLSLWQDVPPARAQLALIAALPRDDLLRLSAPFIAGLPVGTLVTWSEMATFLQANGVKYGEKTLRSAAQNLLSSWAQAGWLTGRAKKQRSEEKLRPAAAALLLRMGHLRGERGAGLYASAEAQALDLDHATLDALALEAGRQGLLTYRRIGDILEISFSSSKNTGESA